LLHVTINIAIIEKLLKNNMKNKKIIFPIHPTAKAVGFLGNFFRKRMPVRT
jgi:hypothetical protein